MRRYVDSVAMRARWLVKKVSAPSISAPVRCSTSLVKAASISFSVPAYRRARARLPARPSPRPRCRGFGDEQERNRGGGGDQLVQQGEPLCSEARGEHADTGDVSARTAEAGNQTGLDRIVAGREDDGDCAGRRLGSTSRNG